MSPVIAANNVLHKIGETAKQRVLEAQKLRSLAQIQDEWRGVQPKPKDFAKAFVHDWNVIAEVKKASPSQGDIAADIDHMLVAQDYLNNGAAALSVLTEPLFFKGKIDYLVDIRKSFKDAYILQKDFVVDIYQIYEAALIGADSILLIVAMLGEKQTKSLYEAARQIGISVLMEVHDRNELEIAKRIGATLIGVNNRNLKDMSISLDNSRDLIDHMPANAIPITESGLTSHADLVELKALGYKAFLVGTQLMQGGQPGKALKELCGYGD
ncbi:MAG: indole-3-glycerol phosphate synthase TrpC [Proteobacteria bacterium]|nr:MAG: indole-3-glycerol phosphate synthase TrpC [Pseudomonadota bacterium]